MSGKKRKTIASITFIVIVLIVSVTTYINRFNDTELKNLETTLEINENLTSFSLLKNDDKDIFKHNGVKVYPYRVAVYTKDSFLNLSDEDKLKELGNVASEIDSYIGMSTYIHCGRNKYCDIDEIIAINPNGNSETYSIKYEKDKEIADYNMEVTNDVNGNFETKTVSTNGGNDSDSSSETSTNSSDSKIVEITSTNANVSGNYIYVKGTIKNVSDSPKTYIEIKVLYLNDNGDILNTETTYLNGADPLLPDEQKSFEVMTEIIGEKYTNYKVQVGKFSE